MVVNWYWILFPNKCFMFYAVESADIYDVMEAMQESHK